MPTLDMNDYTQVDAEGEQIPELMQRMNRWCFWRLEPNPGGRPTKRPDQSTTQLKACRQWQDVKGKQRWSEGGIGFVTTGQLGVKLSDGSTGYLTLVDLDACRDPTLGTVADWAVYIIHDLLRDTYTEVSPSGTGLRVVVVVKKQPHNVRAKVDVPYPALGPGNKKPNIQLFGLGPAGYVAMTGQRLAATPGILVVESLDELVKAFSMLETVTRDGVAQLNGNGAVPTLAEITSAVEAGELGPELIAGDWKKVTPDRSASEAYYLLVQRAFNAAHGHGERTMDWLLECTAWGKGAIDDSADPGKYTRAKWVARELQRVAARKPPVNINEVFEELPLSPPASPAEASTLPASTAIDLRAVFENEGPLVHLPTGIETLDNMTGGGLVLGSRAYAIGAPDAGKTLLIVQILDHYLQQGIPVAILGVDEEPTDIGSRLLQRRGIAREEIEQRSQNVLAHTDALMKQPLLLFDGSTSIESAATQLHQLACRLQPGVERPPCVLFIDSVQTARSEKDDDNDSLYKLVTHRVRMIRAAASRYRMLVVATSEMSRAAYRSRKQDEQARDMAAAKESGAIEFSARVLLSLRNVNGVSDVVELRVVKNKHGPSHRDDQDGIFLRVDRGAQQLTEDQGFEPIGEQELKVNAKNDKVLQLAGRFVALLVMQDLGRNEAVRMLGLKGNRELEEVTGWLEEVGAIVTKPGPGRRTLFVLVPAKLPPEVNEAMRQAMKES